MEFIQQRSKEIHYRSLRIPESGLQNVHAPLSCIIYLHIYFS